MRNSLLLAVLILLASSAALVSVAAADPPAIRADAAYNLLNNPGLEDYDPPYRQWHGVDAQVASGWERFWYDDPEPAWMDGIVYDQSPFGCQCWVERIEGETAQFLVSYNPYQAGILQRVTGLTPGVGYGFHAVLLTIYGGAGTPVVPNRMFKQIGVDPTGGTDPQAPTVIWTAPNGEDKAWDLQQRTSFWAEGTAATVFVQVISLDPATPAQLGILDSTILAQTPGVSAWSPDLSPEPTFAVSWDNVELAPGAKKFRGCDVQWLDEAEGVWHDWFTQTFETGADFAGQWGHAYRFRARAWQQYQNNAWLYSPYRPGGDSRTVVSQTRLTGQVLSPRGWPVPGAVVALTGVPLTTTTGADGRYTLSADPWPEDASVTVSHRYWGSPASAYGVEPPPGCEQTIDWALRSPHDRIANGEFEEGLEGWAVRSEAGVTPCVVGDPVHTGHAAASLGGPSDLPHTTGVSQTLDLEAAWAPGLAFWYLPSRGDGGDRFNVIVTVAAGAGQPIRTTQVFTPSLDLDGWGHAWYPLEAPDGAVSGRITVQFMVRDEGAAATLVTLDEVSLGAMPGGPRRIYFPLVVRP
jgi:hypothetical protein